MTLQLDLIQAARTGDNTKLDQLLADIPEQEKTDILSDVSWHLAKARDHRAVMLLHSKGGSLERALTFYVFIGDVTLTEAAIADGVDVNLPDVGNGITPLHTAAFYGYREIVQALLAANANVNAETIYRDTPLSRAAEQGGLAIISTLIAADADVNAQKTDGTPVLILAMRNRHPDRNAIVAALIQAGANIFKKDPDGKTPLQLAATNGDINLINILLTAFVQPGHYPMPFVAVQRELQHILARPHQMPPHLADSLHFYQLLHEDNFAAAAIWLATHQSLLLHFITNDGSTLHHYVAANFSKAPTFMTALFKRLDKKGIHEKYFYDGTVLHTAAQHNHPEVLVMLLEDGADPFAKDNFGFTALARSCYHRTLPADDRLRTVKILRDAALQCAHQVRSFEYWETTCEALENFQIKLSPALRNTVDLAIPESLQNTLIFYRYMSLGYIEDARECLAENNDLSLHYTIDGQSLYHYIAERFHPDPIALTDPLALTNILNLLPSAKHQHRSDPYALDGNGKCAYEVVAAKTPDLTQLPAMWFAAKSHHALFQLLNDENSKLITKIFVEGFIPTHEMVVIAENANNIADRNNMVLSPTKQMRLLSKEIDCLFVLATAAEDSLPAPLITKLNTWGTSTATKAASSKLLTADEHKKFCVLVLQIQNTNRSLLRDNASPAAAANIRDDQKNIIVSNDFLTDVTNTSSNFFTMTGTASPFANIRPLICARHLMP